MLLVLQTGFAVADTADTAGRKSFLPETVKPRHRLLVRQDATCPAGSFLCDNGTGCCDIGTTCGYRASDNYPICEGGTCNGGPICLSGLCCDLGYLCDEVAKLCTLDTSGGGGGGSFSSSAPSFTAGSSSVRNTRSSGSSTRTVTRTLSSVPTTTLGFVSTSTPDDQESSSDFFGFGDATSTPQTTATPTTDSGFGGSNSQPTTVHSTLTRPGLPVPTGDAAALSANSGMKVFAGAVAGVLAFVL